MKIQFTEYRKDVISALTAISPESISQAASLIKRAKAQNAMIYIVGNGGSAATASHFANDLLKVGGVRAFSLPDMIPTLLAYGNDEGWENMFSHALKRLLLPQDVVIGISCSGFSSNVVNAVELAKTINLPSIKTLVMTGNTWDTPLTKLNPDVTIHVPFADIRVQEDCHLVVCHAIVGMI